MLKEFLSAAGSFLSEHELFRLGVIAVSIVIFLMGVLKSALINKISNKLVRKLILAWGSIIIALPVTAAIVYLKELQSAHFWTFYVINCVSTIITYWFYENTALRDTLSFIGKKALSIFTCDKPECHKETIKDIQKEVESLLETPVKSTSYKDDDLKNL